VTVEREVLLFIRPTTEVRTEMEEEQVRGLIERFRKVENRGRPSRRERKVRKRGEN